MELCIIITVFAAFFQNIRSAVQKYLKGSMGTTGATFVRFGFGIPFAFLFWAAIYQYSGAKVPNITGDFWFWGCVAALAQIAATFLLINGQLLIADEADATLKTLALAASEIDQHSFADWLRSNTQAYP